MPSIGAGFRQSIDYTPPLDAPAQTLDRERGSGAVAQQSLEPGSVVGLHGHARIEGEPAPVSPLAHVFGRLGAEKASALEQAQHPAPHEAPNSADVALAEYGGGMELQFPNGALTEDPVDDTNVEV